MGTNKKILACYLVLAMILAPAVCSGSADEDTQKAEEKTVVSLWSVDRHSLQFMTEQIENFNATNTDNIEIDFQVYTNNFSQAVELAFDTGNAPDIFRNGANILLKMVPAGNLLALNDFLTDEDMGYFGKSNFMESLNTFDGKIYSLPTTGTTTRLFYNKDIFEKAGIKKVPATFDELVETSKQITDKLKGEGIYGFALPFKNPLSALERSADFIVTADAGIRSGYDFKTGAYDFSGYMPFIEALNEIITSGSAFPGCDQLDIDPLRTQFAAGKIAMYISYTHAEPGVYQNQFPTEENWGVAALPSMDGNPKYAQVNTGGTYYMVNAETENPEAAWKVMEFLHSLDLQMAYHEDGLGISLLPEVLEKAAQPETIAKWPMIAFEETDKLWPMSPAGVPLEGEGYYSMLGGYALGNPGYEDLNAIVADLNTRYNDALERGVADGIVDPLIIPDFDPANPGDF